MTDKLKVGILGATGIVGQNYIILLEDHPWFDVVYLAASPNSAGKKYSDVVDGRWQMSRVIPEKIRHLIVHDANNPDEAKLEVDFVFSALELDKELTRKLEEKYAGCDIPVISNASAHRETPDVPMIIPEINPDHADIIPIQRKRYGWKRGFIAVKPNCSIQSYLTPVYALIKNGYDVKKIIITTMQAVSGAGYPGVAALDIWDNVVPFIRGEEEKTENEPRKILGRIDGDNIVSDTSMKISAHCNRVPVVDGHTACVSLEFGERKPALDEIIKIWRDFSSVPQELNLPSAPKHAIIYRDEPDRPQPRKDRNSDGGMAVSVGRLRECSVFDVKFTGLSHNTIRGAAGGGILNAELLMAKGYF